MNKENESGAESVSGKSKVAQNEERVLQFWNENTIFKKSLEKDSPNGEFVFYDGPPFATGLPHFGHILPTTMKDAIPRYQTMKGKRVARKWGWDCHGLPIENLIQKENNLESKEDIEKFGLKEFATAAKNSVLRYDAEWKKIIPRMGRFVDMEDKYTTMDATFTESVWWMFKTLHEKGLAYEGFKSMHVCPSCETPLSNFEVNQGYKMIKDLSVTAKFKLNDEENTYMLAWTTTPWTLPGNVALAVGPEIEYVRVSEETENGKSEYIVASERLADVFEGKTFTEISRMKGSELVGKSYTPVFDFFKDVELENKENIWKVYTADFVTTEDGTGIVHIAPGFGDDDYNLGFIHKLPLISHVNQNGTFRAGLGELTGHHVKPKDDHSAGDVMIVKILAGNGTLFSKLKYEHTYPHCWRCSSPLINYATASWYIKVTDLRDKLVEENEKVNWIPENVGKARFGNWLKEAKDWSISRSRFWGAPIPVWKSSDGEEVEVLGSVADIKSRTKSKNTYVIMRHGEADHNVGEYLNQDDSSPSHLTEKGKEEVKHCVKGIKAHTIDIIFASPLIRTQESAKIIAEAAGLSTDIIITDDRLKEVQVGEFNGKSLTEYRALFKNQREKFDKAPTGGETLSDVRKRVGEFLYEIDKKYEGKNILIVTHEYVVWALDIVRDGLDKKQGAELKDHHTDYIAPGEYADFDFSPLPHNDDYELDFHRPYIDEVVYEKNGKEMKRIPDVFDTWIDSGSMPFASQHYPFSKEDVDPENGKFFPADFIAEGLDQTRGWFYTLLVLNVALFGRSPYKNVIVNGLVLAEDGRKMSKSLQNYPDMMLTVDKFGADALRYFLVSSPAVRAEEVAFSEKGLDEVMKKLLMRLENVVAFYEMYRGESSEGDVSNPNSENVLDKWIVARLFEIRKVITESLDKYELDRASRPILDFVDDLSTWYIRRSRDRFKSNDDDTKQAIETTRYVLYELSKLMAPFVPFISEDVYQRVTGFNYSNSDKSVHLDNWPEEISFDQAVLDEMEGVRALVNVSLEARATAGIKVRQPLQTLYISSKYKNISENLSLVDVLKDELNVKYVAVSDTLKSGGDVEFDFTLSATLLEEGAIRDLIRSIQAMRKNAGLEPDDRIALTIDGSDSVATIVQKFTNDIQTVAGVSDFLFEKTPDTIGEEMKFLDELINISIQKL